MLNAFHYLFSLLSISGALSIPTGTAPDELIILPVEREVELALSAAPSHLRTDASVYLFDKKGYTKFRAGSNGVNCLVNRDGQQSGGKMLRPTCWDKEGSASILPVVLMVGEGLAQKKTSLEIGREVDVGYQSGRFFSPRHTGITALRILSIF